MAEAVVGAGGFVALEGGNEAVNPVHIKGLVGTDVEPGETQTVGVVAVVAAAELVVFDIEGEEALVAAQDVLRQFVHDGFARFFHGHFRRLQDDVGAFAVFGREELAPMVDGFGVRDAGHQ